MTRPMRAVRSLHHDEGDRPFIVIWEVTRACALACRHCRADAIPTRDGRELDTSAGRRLLDQIASFGVPRPLVVLTGGDPFERPDLIELVAYGSSLGLSMSVSPSVTPRLTREVLAELAEAGTKAVSVSLDGATAVTHDAFRGIDGVFADTVDAMAAVRDAGLRLQINTTVTADTVREMPDVLRIVLDAGASLWSVFSLVPTGRGSHLRQLPPGDQEDVLQWLHDVADLVPVKTTEAAHFRRVAVQRATMGASSPGSGLVVVLAGPADPTGALGNRAAPDAPADRRWTSAQVEDSSSSTMWAMCIPVVSFRCARAQSGISRLTWCIVTSPLLMRLRDSSALTGRCGRCEFRSVCGGSRSQAYAASGDLMGEDPTCVWDPP